MMSWFRYDAEMRERERQERLLADLELDRQREAAAMQIRAVGDATLHEDWRQKVFYVEAGRKDDAGKTRYELIAPEFLDGTAEILTFGARKYGDRNWEKGMSWSRPFGALMRHMWAWWRGEKADAETGKSHLLHASCCLMFLIAFEARKAGKDDRPAKNMVDELSDTVQNND